MANMLRRSRTGVLTVVLTYAFCGSLWILLSDRAMELLVRDPEALVRASIAKGWFFVAVTTVLLYVLVRRMAGALAASYQRELSLEREREQPPPMLVAIADATADAIFAKDEEGRYLLFSKASLRIVGKSAEEVLGKNDLAIFPPGQAAELMSHDRRIRATGVTETREEVLHTADGERVFHAIKGPLRGADGSIFGTYGISRDITDRKRAELQLHESQGRLRLLVDHVPAAVAMFDRSMCYLEVSRRWREDNALGDIDLIGRSHYEVFPMMQEAWKDVHRRALAGETVSSEEDFYLPVDGRAQWLRWEVRPWLEREGRIGGIVIFAEDISERKNAEVELRSRNEELERFNRAAIERELRMIALKREVNELACAAGRAAPYDVSFADGPGA
jgi:PAS domain S-box-containing protein